MTQEDLAAATDTPIGYVDLARVRANAQKVVHYATAHGLGWRPHIKTHKSRAVARIQLDAGARGLTVATLREAEVMADLTSDLLLAYPPVGPARVERLLRLPDHVDLKVGLDSEAVLRPLAERSVAAGRTTGVLVEVDVGLRRVGVPDVETAVRLCGLARELDGIEYCGVMLYPGHIRVPAAEQQRHIAELAVLTKELVAALGSADLAPRIVSGGSTPTLWQSHRAGPLTEIRSGSCIFYDREGVRLGVAGLDEVAYTVLATVVSTQVAGQAVVDAGSKALAKEGRGGDGFGVVLDHPEVTVRALSEEHGVLDLTDTDWRPGVGDRVRIVPNHVCVSVNLQDELLARDGDEHSLLALEARGRAPWTA